MESPGARSHPQPRRLAPEDADAYVALRREMILNSPTSFGSSPDDDGRSDPAAIRDALTNPEYAILGIFDPTFPGARPAGAMSASLLAVAGVSREEKAKERQFASIWGAYVTPGARNRGLGRAVITSAIETARTWPVSIIRLSVTEPAIAARRLYESLGFIPWGTEPDALWHDGRRYAEIHMHLRLR